MLLVYFGLIYAAVVVSKSHRYVGAAMFGLSSVVVVRLLTMWGLMPTGAAKPKKDKSSPE